MSLGVPNNSFKSLSVALVELQGHYAVLKERAEEREKAADREIASLTHRVTSLETEVQDLRGRLEVGSHLCPCDNPLTGAYRALYRRSFP